MQEFKLKSWDEFEEKIEEERIEVETTKEQLKEEERLVSISDLLFRGHAKES